MRLTEDWCTSQSMEQVTLILKIRGTIRGVWNIGKSGNGHCQRRQSKPKMREPRKRRQKRCNGEEKNLFVSGFAFLSQFPLQPPLLPPGGANPGGRACMLPHPLHLRGVDMAEHYGGITPVLYINKTNDKDVVRGDQEVF